MQWFIDTIKELIHGQLGFFNRGDPAAADWTQLTLTNDFAWHVLDCSAIVPAGAKAILLNIGIEKGVINHKLHIRQFGNVNTPNRIELRTQVANQRIYQDGTCPCGSDRKLEYRLGVGAWQFVAIIVKGWWLR